MFLICKNYNIEVYRSENVRKFYLSSPLIRFQTGNPFKVSPVLRYVPEFPYISGTSPETVNCAHAPKGLVVVETALVVVGFFVVVGPLVVEAPGGPVVVEAGAFQSLISFRWD